jgi:Asp/Glu/Hydantoin racemase
MNNKPKIYLVHAVDVAMPPIVESFRVNWPQARVVNLLEDALMADLAIDGKLTDAMIDRFVRIGQYCVKASADAILFTCSAFGPAIDECRRQLSIPVLKPNEALYEQLVARNGAVSLLATFQPSLPAMLSEIAECAKAKGAQITVQPHLVDGALAALQDNRPDDGSGRAAADVRRDCAGAVFDGAGQIDGGGAYFHADFDHTRQRGREAEGDAGVTARRVQRRSPR